MGMLPLFLNDNSLAMIDFMLNDLGGKAGKRFAAGLEVRGQILHIHRAVAKGLFSTGMGKTALFRLVVFFGMFYDHRVQHGQDGVVVVHHDDTLIKADHVGGKTHTALGVGLQGVDEILHDGKILLGGRFGFAVQGKNVGYNGSYHRIDTSFLFKVYRYCSTKTESVKGKDTAKKTKRWYNRIIKHKEYEGEKTPKRVDFPGIKEINDGKNHCIRYGQRHGDPVL